MVPGCGRGWVFWRGRDSLDVIGPRARADANSPIAGRRYRRPRRAGARRTWRRPASSPSRSSAPGAASGEEVDERRPECPRRRRDERAARRADRVDESGHRVADRRRPAGGRLADVEAPSLTDRGRDEDVRSRKSLEQLAPTDPPEEGHRCRCRSRSDPRVVRLRSPTGKPRRASASRSRKRAGRPRGVSSRRAGRGTRPSDRPPSRPLGRGAAWSLREDDDVPPAVVVDERCALLSETVIAGTSPVRAEPPGLEDIPAEHRHGKRGLVERDLSCELMDERDDRCAADPTRRHERPRVDLVDDDVESALGSLVPVATGFAIDAEASASAHDLDAAPGLPAGRPETDDANSVTSCPLCTSARATCSVYISAPPASG